MANQPTTCLSDEQLEAIASGLSTSDVLADSAEHVRGCPRCADRLADARRDRFDTISFGSGTDHQGAGSTVAQPDSFLKNLDYLRSMFEAPRSPDFLAAFGRYDIEGAIGRGGMGIVLKAIDRSLNRKVAIKVLSPDLAGNDLARARFQREAFAAAALGDQDYVVTIYEVGEEHGLPYLSMQYVPDGSLQQRITRDGALEEELARRIGANVLSALAFSHQEGLIHRDVKPSNILLDDAASRAKLTDFGLARGVDDASLTVSGTIVGTAQYMPPEQASGDKVDERSDLYSVGAVLFAMCAGRPPFQSDSPLRMFQMVCEEPPPSLRSIAPRVSQGMERLVQSLLAKNPADRPDSAGELASLLESGFAGYPAAGGAAATPGGPAAAPRDANAKLALGVDFGSRQVRLGVGLEDSDVEVASAPSVVVAKGDQLLTGPDAQAAAEADPSETARDLAYRLGSRMAKVRLGDSDYPSEALVALALSEHLRRAGVNDAAKRRVAYTTPGCYGALPRRAMANALAIAGFESAEPIDAAAALAIDFGAKNGWFEEDKTSATRRMLVVNCGAHTFDATVLRCAAGRIELTAVAGDPTLGGDAWTVEIMKRVARQVASKHELDLLSDRVTRRDLHRRCEAAKLNLMESGEVRVRVPAGGDTFQRVVSRQFLTWISEDTLKRCLRLVRHTVTQGGVELGDLDYVLLSGGGALQADFRAAMKQLTAGRVQCLLGPVESAASGAERFGRTLELSGDVGVSSVSGFSYEVIEHVDGASHKSTLVEAGAPLPAEARFTIDATDAEAPPPTFHLVERANHPDAAPQAIAVGRVKGLSPGGSNGATVELVLAIDRGGRVSVALEERQRLEGAELAVKWSNNLSDNEIPRWREWLATQLKGG